MVHFLVPKNNVESTIQDCFGLPCMTLSATAVFSVAGYV